MPAPPWVRRSRLIVLTTEAKTVSFWVPGGPRAAGVARRSVLSVQVDLPASIRHRLALLLSELVTNAIQHGGAGPDETVMVRVESTMERVRVEVHDPGSNGIAARDRLEPEGGYGLLLLDRLSESWGHDRSDSGGSLAWFELTLDPSDHY
jgi:anti-sigma regulatory factor (Ser/Thr protein kinase)